MTNSQNNILIRLAQTSYPRTLDALHAETGYPKPSIRRIIHELNQLPDYDIQRKESTGEYVVLSHPSGLRGRMGQTDTPFSHEAPTV